MSLDNQCLSDELKFMATSELILEPYETYLKKKKKDETIDTNDEQFTILRDKIKVL